MSVSVCSYSLGLGGREKNVIFMNSCVVEADMAGVLWSGGVL